MVRFIAIAAFALLASGCGDFAIGIAYDKPSVLALPDRSNAHLSLAADGDHVAAAWAASNSAGTDIYAAFSRDGGAHFSAPVRVNDVPGDANAGGEQPPRIVLKDQRVNVVWVSKHDGAAAIRAAASSDGGATFSRATTITPPGLTGARGWESTALSDDGALHAVCLTEETLRQHHRTAPRASCTGAPSAPHAPMRQDIYHAIWRGTDPPIETQVAANVCFCCKTAIVYGRDVKIAWRHLFDGGIRDIAVARFADSGATFSAPVRVSADNWKIDACPGRRACVGSRRRACLHIAWPTMVHDTAGDRIAIFEAESADAGATFTPRRRVDTATTASAAHPRIAIGPAGPAVVWDELAEGERRAWMRVGDGQAVALSPGAGNYPAVAATGRSFVAGWMEQDGERAIVRTRVIRASS